ncbi:MAG: hypothetical protein GF334_04650 [Candidatus Altiarchaeales archaeon]|nr:hypothetical protein [Candidatus Altiarchaeales archaeon]
MKERLKRLLAQADVEDEESLLILQKALVRAGFGTPEVPFQPEKHIFVPVNTRKDFRFPCPRFKALRPKLK